MFGWKKKSPESTGNNEGVRESFYSFILGDHDASEIEGTYLGEQCRTAAEFDKSHPEAAAAYIELVNMTDANEVSQKIAELNSKYCPNQPASGGYQSWIDGGRNKSGSSEIRVISYSDGNVEFRWTS